MAKPPSPRRRPRHLKRAAALFTALANDVRLSVLLALDDRGPMSVGALAAVLGVEQSALSHQLATLRCARLVTADHCGRQRIYRLVDAHVGHIVRDAMSHANERSHHGRRTRS